MNLRTAMLNGHKYNFFFNGKVNGTCETHDTKDRHISIMTKPRTRNELITLIHEMLHAENWDASEAKVTRVADEIGCALWRAGYRREL